MSQQRHDGQFAAAPKRCTPSRLVAARGAEGQHAEPQAPPQRFDYPANASDKELLQQHPGADINIQDATNCFDYPRNLRDRYAIMEEIGKGGFAHVYRAALKENGVQYACKSMPKRQPRTGQVTPHHLLRIRAEVDAMRQLGASLDAAALKEVFEDDEHVHIIMELCEGGPLLKPGETPAHSEQDVADIMRSVLRFLAQCAAKGIVYRDVKPVNFLFSDKSPSRRVKATDFGLAVQHSADDSPLTAVTGTPLFLAPEVVRKQYGSQADVYSAGVMAFLLLTGRLPYSPNTSGSNLQPQIPGPQQTMEKIASEDINFSGLSELVSRPAQDFLRRLLEKDPNRRPTAAEALDHPWLAPREDGRDGRSAGGGTVQALQRFGVTGAFRQVAIKLVAAELVAGGHGELLRGAAASSDMVDEIQLPPPGSNLSSFSVPKADVMACIASSESYDLSPVEAAQLVSHMDVTNSGDIDGYELISSLVDWEEVAKEAPKAWEEALGKVFARLDRKGDGAICMADIQEHMSAHHAPANASKHQQAVDMLRDVDNDSDGRITWSEFREAMTPGGAVSMMPALHHFDSRQ